MPAPTRLDTRQILAAFRATAPGDVFLSGHRGLRWDGIPRTQRKASVLNAARFALVSIEVDVPLTADKVPVLVPDRRLGRLTSDIYSPFTGKGYSPRVDTLSWSEVSQRRLKDEHGRVTEHGVLSLATFLDLIKAEALDFRVFLDIKEKEAIPMVRMEAAALIIPHPGALEAEPWFQHALGTSSPLIVPVIKVAQVHQFDGEVAT
ncbi:glycerophosphoryl diester phosphodiesterase [Vanrija albida]|uniref:Glycerophosphoryl diester phosphodiesterase n=1 Tax=Vanrija albida TaxID=181172 RepID=A0ABR3Q1K3_9TREE